MPVQFRLRALWAVVQEQFSNQGKKGLRDNENHGISASVPPASLHVQSLPVPVLDKRSTFRRSDSMVIDSLHAAPVSRPVDTVTRQNTVVSPVSADTMTRQTGTSTSVPVDTAVHQYKSIKPDTVEPAPIMNTEEASVVEFAEVRRTVPFFIRSRIALHCGISFEYFSYAEVMFNISATSLRLP